MSAELRKKLYAAEPVNPGRQPEPDLAKTVDSILSAEERETGGLGIHIVKKMMDAVSYEYKDGENILKIKKFFDK